jgi:hypothetical protein
MQSWRRFRSLSAADRVIVAEAAVLLVLIRAAIPVLPFLSICDALRTFARIGRVSPGQSDSARTAWGVTAAARHLPLRTTCLIESLAVDAMLRRRSIACDIRFGVRPPGRGALAAHAWVEQDGAIVYGARPDLSDYAVLTSQGAGRATS